jgi:hypothetical protein
LRTRQSHSYPAAPVAERRHPFISQPPADNLADFRRSLKPASVGETIVPGSVSATVIGGIIGPPRLEVSCMAITPTPGFTAKLHPMKPQGFNPAVLILQLVLTPPRVRRSHKLGNRPLCRAERQGPFHRCQHRLRNPSRHRSYPHHRRRQPREIGWRKACARTVAGLIRPQAPKPYSGGRIAEINRWGACPTGMVARYSTIA